MSSSENQSHFIEMTDRELLMAQRIFGSAQVFSSAFQEGNGGVGQGTMTDEQFELELRILAESTNVLSFGAEAGKPSHGREQLLGDIAKVVLQRLATLARGFMALYEKILMYGSLGLRLDLDQSFTWKKMAMTHCVASVRILEKEKLVRSLDAEEVNRSLSEINRIRQLIIFLFESNTPGLQDWNSVQEGIIGAAKALSLVLNDDANVRVSYQRAQEFLESLRQLSKEEPPRAVSKKHVHRKGKRVRRKKR